MKNFSNFYYGKKVLVTGHTGFKGTWLSSWLIKLGSKVYGISLKPKKISMFNQINLENKIKNYYFDISDKNKLEIKINQIKPDIIFHLAAQSLLPISVKDPYETWKTNILGTASLLGVLKGIKKKITCIIITSDKCYENKEMLWGYKETDTLGGKDPYSSSKAAAEIIFSSFVKTYVKDKKNLLIASARAGNVIGGGDYSEFRIVPDCIKAWKNNKLVHLRNPNSTRPWQFVLEPLRGYLQLAYKLNLTNVINGESFNFGPSNDQEKSVLELVKKFSDSWSKAKWKIFKHNKFNESGLLKLNCEKAHKLLEWSPQLNFDNTVKFTSDWYRNVSLKKDKNYLLTLKQIDDYENLING